MATRESEKQLMKELEQAVKDLDAAQQEADIAKGIYDVQAAKYRKATEEANKVAKAITALRGVDRSAADIFIEARNNAKKEKPVA